MRRLAPWFVVLLCACGPKGNDTDDAGDSGVSSTSDATASTGAASTGGTPTTGETASTGEPPTTGDTSSTGDGLCEDPVVPVGPVVQIAIHNNHDEALAFVDLEIGCKQVQPFAVVGPDATPLKLDLGFFEFACVEGRSGPCGRDPGCPVGGRVVQIDAGGSYPVAWSGGAWEVAPIAEACADQFCSPCWAERQAPAATYTVRVTSSPTITACNEGACKPCESDAAWCVTEGTRVEANVVEVVLEYPGQTALDIFLAGPP